MKNNKKLTSLGFSIFFAILSGITLFMAISKQLHPFYGYDESNTVQYHLTVDRVKADKERCTVFVEEFDCGVWFSLDEIVYENYLDELNVGAQITIRIPEFSEQFLSFTDAAGVFLVSLKTDTTEIVTLKSHNIIEEKGEKRLLSAIYLFFSIFIILTVICFVLFLVKRKHKEQIS